jgi:hypothetical protein
MEQKIYGAALYLNPDKFFTLRDKDRRQATRLRAMFNDVLWKMMSDEDEQTKISKQADDYERMSVSVIMRSLHFIHPWTFFFVNAQESCASLN